MPRNTFIKFLAVLLVVLVSVIYSFGGGFGQLNVFLNTQKEIPIYSVDTSEKKIALTFDVSFGTDYTDKIMDILEKNNVKATFFVVGEWAEKNPDKVKKIFDKGFEIGNHSNSHIKLTGLKKNKIKEEVLEGSEKIKKITGVSTDLFRMPYGEYDSEVVKTVEKAKHTCIQWDVDSMDLKNPGTYFIYNNVLNTVDNGSIVLFHADMEQTPLVLDRIIKELKARGYSLVTASDLIYKGNYYIDHTGRQRQEN